MRTVAAALVAVAAVAVPAYAGPVHQVTGTCSTVYREALWDHVGAGVVTAYAVSGGSVRAVSTSVSCTVTWQYVSPTTVDATSPGPVAVAVAPAISGYLPTICVTATGYFADGVQITATQCAQASSVTAASSQ